jgi:hypothetical protein
MAEQTANASAPDAGYFLATLVRGVTYTFKGATFRKGEPRKVSEATKDYLINNAFEDVSVGEGADMEIERRAKFEFRDPNTPAPAVTRKRAR